MRRIHLVKDFSVPLMLHDPSDLGLFCQFQKETQNFSRNDRETNPATYYLRSVVLKTRFKASLLWFQLNLIPRDWYNEKKFIKISFDHDLTNMAMMKSRSLKKRARNARFSLFLFSLFLLVFTTPYTYGWRTITNSAYLRVFVLSWNVFGFRSKLVFIIIET